MPPIPEDKILSINIKTYGSFVKLPVNHLAGHTVISIDVLRSSSCIVWGLVNGASKIIPVDDLGSAVSIASRMGDCVLAGERGAVLIPGWAARPLSYQPPTAPEPSANPSPPPMCS